LGVYSIISDSSHVTVPYKLRFIIIIVIKMLVNMVSLSVNV